MQMTMTPARRCLWHLHAGDHNTRISRCESVIKLVHVTSSVSMTLVWANRLCNLTHCVLFHPLCNFTQCVIWLTIQHTSHNFHTTHGFEFSDGSLCCSVARQLLLQIYALSSVKFPHLKLQFCKKMTNMRYWVSHLAVHRQGAAQEHHVFWPWG